MDIKDLYKFRLGSLILMQLCFCSCEKELELNFPVTASRLVVEGWIENGKNAEIILSHSAPYFTAIDSNSLPDFAETHAKVTLFCGSQSEILTLKPNQAYFPPFVYKSTVTLGEAGKSYFLEIVLNGDTVTASTTIPDPVNLDSVWFAPDPGQGPKGRIWIRLSDNPSRENFYRILYKRKGRDSQFVSSDISAFSDVLYNGKTVEMGFLRGMSSMIAIEEDHYFEAGDTVSLKFCSIDKIQFDYWNVYQNKVIASANPLSASNYQLKSNIKGGLGIFTGYGATYYLVGAR